LKKRALPPWQKPRQNCANGASHRVYALASGSACTTAPTLVIADLSLRKPAILKSTSGIIKGDLRTAYSGLLMPIFLSR
jgi:hypothetical protein